MSRSQIPSKAAGRGRAQSGQALAAFIALLAAFVGALLWTFNVGQIVNEKERLVDAADAAALSGATLQARALNLESYLNRAHVANEVAIAQAVSMRSWISTQSRFATNVNRVTRYLGPVGRVSEAVQKAIEALAGVVNVSAFTAETTLAGIETVLEAASAAVRASMVGAADRFALDVLRATDARFDGGRGATAARVINDAAWLGFTRRNSRVGEERARLRAVVLESRDGFTQQRNGSLGVPLATLREAGGTDLLRYDAWRGLDTISLHVRLLFTSRELPLGWAVAQAGRPAFPLRGVHGGAYRANRRAAALAERSLPLRMPGGVPSVNGLWRGLPAFDDVSDPRSVRDPRLPFSVAAEVVRDRWLSGERVLPRAAAIDGAGRRIEFSASTPGDRLYATAAAEVYFARPLPRRDGQHELGSLFNPYWQVRLAPVSRAARVAIAAARDVPDVEALAP